MVVDYHALNKQTTHIAICYLALIFYLSISKHLCIFIFRFGTKISPNLYIKERCTQNGVQNRLGTIGLRPQASTTFKGVINQVFHKLNGKFELMNFDDILISSKSEDELVLQLKQVLQVLWENLLYAEMGKCQFGKDALQCLNHVVNKEGMKWILENLKLLQNGIGLLKLDNYGLPWGIDMLWIHPCIICSFG